MQRKNFFISFQALIHLVESIAFILRWQMRDLNTKALQTAKLCCIIFEVVAKRWVLLQ